MKDAKTRWRVIQFLATLLALVVMVVALGAVLMVDRNAEEKQVEKQVENTEVEKEPRTPRSIEMVRPPGRARSVPNTPSVVPDSPGKPAADAILSPLPITSLSAEVYDLVMSASTGGDTDNGEKTPRSFAAATPRSLETGTPVYLSDSPEVPLLLHTFVSFVLETGSPPPVPPDRLEQVTDRVDAFRNTVGEVDRIYHLESEGTTGHVLIRGQFGSWWHLWIYSEDGSMVDLEFLPVSEEG